MQETHQTVKTVINQIQAIADALPEKRIYVKSPQRFIADLPTRDNIIVLPADDPEEQRMGWVIYNDYAIANIAISGPYIISVKRTINPILDMDDWISEEYWPEWEVVFDNDVTYFIAAPTEEHAKLTAHQQYNADCSNS